MIFEKNAPLYSFEVSREGGQDILYFNYFGSPTLPSISESPMVMARVIDALLENPSVSRVIFVQQHNYSHDFNQISLLLEIAQVYNYLVKQERIVSAARLAPVACQKCLGNRYNAMNYLVLSLLKQDPVGCYVETKRIIREEHINAKRLPQECLHCEESYIRILHKLQELLEKTSLIRMLGELEGYHVGSRDIYRRFFKADVIPNFTFTRLVSGFPSEAEIVTQYEIASGFDKSTVTILRMPNETKMIYHIIPPEYALEENHYSLLNLARNVLIEHRPKAEEFTDTERTRNVFLNIARDLLQELANTKRVRLTYRQLNRLATILVRHTIGFGIIEILLQDEKLQDIVLNSPIGQTAVFVRHQEFDECSTNIVPSKEDADSWAAKFRMISGRPLDEANPVLDTDLAVGKIRARVAVIQQPLSPSGISYAFRRHREDPWTLPLFIKNKMLNPLAAGLLSFMIDGARTLLVAGTRSSGKCVDGNTWIQLANGKIEKIKNLAGTFKYKIDDGEIFSPSYSSVLSLSNMKICHKQITDVWRRKSPEKIIRIKTRSGKQIITTLEHPYPIYSSKTLSIEYKRADNLENGDLIATPRKINSENQEIFFNFKKKDYFVSEEDNFVILKGKTNSSIVRFPKKLTSELAEFIGLLIGDGHIDEKKLEFHNSCRELREKYISFAKIFGVPYRIFNSRTTVVVQISSRTLSRALRDVFELPFGNKAKTVIIPSVILQADNKILASFLRGYFDTDGYIPEMKRDIELATASKDMAELLRLVLLRFGITSFIKTKLINDLNYYRILIRGEFATKFCENIGFSHPKKKERALRILSKDFLNNTNIDIIPDGNEIISNLRSILRVTPKEHRLCGKDYWAYEHKKYRVSRLWFKKIINFYNQRYSVLVSLKDQIQVLEKIANFDYESFFTKLETVRKNMQISYGSLALNCGLSDGGIRKILTNKHNGKGSTLNKLSGAINFMQETSDVADIRIQKLLNNLIDERIMLDSMRSGIIMAKFRTALNISNEELASSGVSLATVTNFFNGAYSPTLKVIQKFAKKIVDIYSKVVCSETQIFLIEANRLANSDVFWDEVSDVEIINKIDDFVYDLSVEDTHNFVANGLIAHNTSLLGSLMLEIMPRNRIIVLEDTLELPVDSLRKLGYNILRMKVRSALLKETTEIAADEGIRTSLRLGDSCLIVGEVRSTEAKALYEAMRIGALANVVAGTIHGASPYGVFDRVVNDLGVPVTSFKATDIITVLNPIKSADGLHSWKRMVQFSEVRKHWTKDPLEEKGFVDLMRYNVDRDELEPTQDLIAGESEVIKSVAANVKGWAGNWDAVWDNILLRANIKQEIVKVAGKLAMPEFLESAFNSKSNSAFHQISDRVREEIGLPEGKIVFKEWQDWLREEIKRKKII